MLLAARIATESWSNQAAVNPRVVCPLAMVLAEGASLHDLCLCCPPCALCTEQRAVQHSEALHSLGKGYFHLRFPLPPSAFQPPRLQSGNDAGPVASGAAPEASSVTTDLLGDMDGPQAPAGIGNGGGVEEASADGNGEAEGTLGVAGHIVPGSLQSGGAQAGEVVLLRYRLLPRFTPVPLRLRLVARRGEETLSLMIQVSEAGRMQLWLVIVGWSA